MPSVHETAYPRLKTTVSAQDLAEVYTPTAEEIAFAHRTARGRTAKRCFLILLKTFQRLGYFANVRDVPGAIREHISQAVAGKVLDFDAGSYDESGTRRRHVTIIRDHLKLRAFDDEGRARLAAVVREAALTKEDLADIINVAIEELVRARFELPGFTTFLKAARRGRTDVNRTLHQRVCDALGAEGTHLLDLFFTTDRATGSTPWNRLKEDAGPATLTQFRLLVRRLHWLTAQNVGVEALATIPTVKVTHFAAEARSLDASRMQRIPTQKRSALAAALVKMQVARTLDDLGERSSSNACGRSTRRERRRSTTTGDASKTVPMP